jgi:hypothetical protein
MEIVLPALNREGQIHHENCIILLNSEGLKIYE